MRYKLHTGSVAWVIHRVSGAVLTLYILLHIYILDNLRDPENYNRMLSLMELPAVRLGKAGLLAFIIAHALNGLRLTLLESGIPTSMQKSIFWSAFSAGGLLFILAVWPVLGGVL